MTDPLLFQHGMLAGNRALGAGAEIIATDMLFRIHKNYNHCFGGEKINEKDNFCFTLDGFDMLDSVRLPTTRTESTQ